MNYLTGKEKSFTIIQENVILLTEKESQILVLHSHIIDIKAHC